MRQLEFGKRVEAVCLANAKGRLLHVNSGDQAIECRTGAVSLVVMLVFVLLGGRRWTSRLARGHYVLVLSGGFFPGA